MSTVLRTAEANAAFGTAAVRRNIRRGTWRRPVPGVVVTHNGPLARHEHQQVVLCSAPPRSTLSGLTALELDGLTGFDQALASVTLPEGARRPRIGGTFHWSTELGEPDVHPHREPRRTRPARSLVDAASWCASHKMARTLVIAAFQQRLVSARTVRESLSRRGPCHRRALIVESVLDATGGIQSLPERDFDEIRQRAGLPKPSRQQRVRGPDGRYYLDAAWEEWGLATEIHGIGHFDVQRWDADLLRSNEIIIGGRRLLAFTSYAVRHEPAQVSDQLLRLFHSAGWINGTDLEATRPTRGGDASGSVRAGALRPG